MMRSEDMKRRGTNSLIRRHPIAAIIVIFVFWKIILLLIAFSSPGQGYDASTTLLSHSEPPYRSARQNQEVHIWPKQDRINKLMRWDAIYFSIISQRGYQFEQEWAFGWGFTRLVNGITRALPQYISPHPNNSPYLAAITAISVAHVSHLLSVLILYHLSSGIFAGTQRVPHAFVTAILHIISPAGLFLSAPYTESLFSFLTIAGLMFYRKALVHTYIEGSSDNARDLNTLVSSIFFGLATTVRGNGLLNGTLFIYDILVFLPSLWESKCNFSQFRRLATLGAGGAVVAIGGLLPQWVAYQEYCQPMGNDVKLRPWCDNTIPSIYVWVQSNYWNVGFLRYWTISNLPLFLLATPMLLIMISSSLWALSYEKAMPRKLAPLEQSEGPIGIMCLRRFALPQLLLSTLAVTNYHVQIITRLSSGYVIWYWWVALLVCADDKQIEVGKWKPQPGKLILRWMVMYGVIQAGLFASFLPPA